MSFITSNRYKYVLIFILFACGQQSATEIADAISQVAKGNANYGFIYTAPPPEGATLQISLFDRSVQDACELFGPNAGKVYSTDFWYIALELGTTEPGEYEIVPYPQSVNDASIQLAHTTSSKTNIKYRATEGLVILRDGVDDARSNIRL